jgi:hypothetical protein
MIRGAHTQNGPGGLLGGDAMTPTGRYLTLALGAVIGGITTVFYQGWQPAVQARPNDRFEDYVMCTGACAVHPITKQSPTPTDAVWLLDYRNGKLMGTVIDRSAGKIVGWGEVDLTSEFELPPKSNVHFLMTTGNITAGQAALYVAEVSSGKFGVYSLGPDVNAQNGMSIRRHDLATFRKN